MYFVFDVETEGQSGDNYMLTAIGSKFHPDGEINVDFLRRPCEEKNLLQRFQTTLIAKQPTLIVWKGKVFDIPFLCTRGLVLGIDMSILNHLKIIDLQEIVAKQFRFSQTRLRDVIALLGIQRDDNFDGSQIARLYLEYRSVTTDVEKEKIAQQIINHCREDVKVTTELFEKIKNYVV